MRTLTSALGTTVAIGVLVLAVGAVAVTSNLQTAQAEPKNCTPYGQLVSREARTTDQTNLDDTGPGFGDEVTGIHDEADPNFGQDFRQPGQRPATSSTCGNSNVAK
jgi:hypothetical protein